MTKSPLSCFKLSLVFCLNLFTFNALASNGFSSIEHLFIGNQVKLAWPSGVMATNRLLKLKGGLNLSYGEIGTLSGDFFAIPSKPISLGQNEDEQRQRFFAAYQSLADSDYGTKEASLYLQLLTQAQKNIEKLEKQHKSPLEYIQAFDDDLSRKANRISGGGSAITDYFPLGRYLKISNHNDDHFGFNALKSYQIGHMLAMQTAIKAGQQNNIALLKSAYAINAFASHYLQDLFSAGHIRTPRTALSHATLFHVVGSLFAKYMHDEDSQQGVKVHNAYESWVAYGDNVFFANRNDIGQKYILQSMQASADEVWLAYQTQQATDFNQSKVKDLIPNIKDANIIDALSLSAPLFCIRDGHVLRRSNVSDSKSYTFSRYWFSLPTLIKLLHSKGSPSHSYKAILKAYLPKSWQRKIEAAS